ncbi:MAG: 50S ribosomal protein L23 [Candidatus Pacebacteria bacterium]|nr:50S ribosomal protein L23 [Candidatus Paceibacterota bacterium]
MAWRSLKQPLISEKATFLEEQGKYIFKVLERTNKREIKKAIEDIYRAKVDKVNIMNTKGKKRRIGQVEGKKPGYKKAIVTLKKGDKIEVVPR